MKHYCIFLFVIFCCLLCACAGRSALRTVERLQSDLLRQKYAHIYCYFNDDVRKELNREMPAILAQETVKRRLITDYGYAPGDIPNLPPRKQLQALLQFSEWPGNDSPLFDSIKTNAALTAEKTAHGWIVRLQGGYSVALTKARGRGLRIADSPFEPVCATNAAH